MNHWIIDSLDSFKRLIHSETKQVTVFMNESLNHNSLDSFKRLIHSETKQVTVFMNESLTHSIHSKPWIKSVMNHCRVFLGGAQQFCCGNIFICKHNIESKTQYQHLVYWSLLQCCRYWGEAAHAGVILLNYIIWYKYNILTLISWILGSYNCIRTVSCFASCSSDTASM